jgi:hypothetical protein
MVANLRAQIIKKYDGIELNGVNALVWFSAPAGRTVQAGG